MALKYLIRLGCQSKANSLHSQLPFSYCTGQLSMDLQTSSITVKQDITVTGIFLVMHFVGKAKVAMLSCSQYCVVYVAATCRY